MTWLQTYSGRAVDLLMPDPADIDFEDDVPIQLARIPRFLGATALPYSVAQHCCLGADVLMRSATTPPALALAFLLHDAQEAYTGDIPTPVAEALSFELVRRGNTIVPAPVQVVWQQIKTLKHRLDVAIYRAAGFANPPTLAWREAIKACDLRMLATERAHMLKRSQKPWHPLLEAAEPYPWRGRIKPWTWPQAADEWRSRFRRLSSAADLEGAPNSPTTPAAPAISKETA